MRIKLVNGERVELTLDEIAQNELTQSKDIAVTQAETLAKKDKDDEITAAKSESKTLQESVKGKEADIENLQKRIEILEKLAGI